jgi:hypothetical protein
LESSKGAASKPGNDTPEQKERNVSFHRKISPCRCITSSDNAAVIKC